VYIAEQRYLAFVEEFRAAKNLEGCGFASWASTTVVHFMLAFFLGMIAVLGKRYQRRDMRGFYAGVWWCGVKILPWGAGRTLRAVLDTWVLPLIIVVLRLALCWSGVISGEIGHNLVLLGFVLLWGIYTRKIVDWMRICGMVRRDA